jgi:hypothetical protein
VKQASWEEFCSLIHYRFGRDQHEALICQMFHIRQSGSVAEFVQQFSELVDQLAAYEADANPLFYAMCFIDGLRDEIKSMVMIQRPSMLDSACALALVQEEAVDFNKKKDHHRHEPFYHRTTQRSSSALSAPTKWDKPPGGSLSEYTWGTEASHASSTDDRLKAL